MTDEINLSRLPDRLADADYPADRDALAATFAGTTVRFADGEADLGDLVADADGERFESADDLSAALQNVLPVGAVGEPGQSDGDA